MLTCVRLPIEEHRLKFPLNIIVSVPVNYDLIMHGCNRVYYVLLMLACNSMVIIVDMVQLQDATFFQFTIPLRYRGYECIYPRAILTSVKVLLAATMQMLL